MKLHRLLCTAALGIACFLSTSGISQGRDRDDDWRRHRDDAHERRAYFAHPRAHFAVGYGWGYAGRGYYFGPPSVPYYYEGPSVVYYRSREAVPREYWAHDSTPAHESSDAAVQRALARRGYYAGAIDGVIGPRSRRAISRYQAEHGLRATGSITPALLRSLRIG